MSDNGLQRQLEKIQELNEPLRQMTLAYEQNHWYARAKYREDIFDSYIIGLIKNN